MLLADSLSHLHASLHGLLMSFLFFFKALLVLEPLFLLAIFLALDFVIYAITFTLLAFFVIFFIFAAVMVKSLTIIFLTMISMQSSSLGFFFFTAFLLFLFSLAAFLLFLFFVAFSLLFFFQAALPLSFFFFFCVPVPLFRGVFAPPHSVSFVLLLRVIRHHVLLFGARILASFGAISAYCYV